VVPGKLKKPQLKLGDDMELTRAEAIRSALQHYKTSGEKAAEPIEFREKQAYFEVVSVGIDVPLLNHENNRLGALLAEHPDRAKLVADPASSGSQEILSSLLKGTKQYKALREQLKDLGQKEPGVITRDGMLVDGNTRLVALRENGALAMTVAVLPENAEANDFFAVESARQFESLVFQDYTYTALLIAVEKIANRYESPEAVFKALRWQRRGPQRLADHRRLLALIREIREVTGKPYPYFDDRKDGIETLDSSYQNLLALDPVGAERFKWSNIFGMELGLNKDMVREIDENFVAEHIVSKTRSDDADRIFDADFVSTDTPSGLDGLISPVDPSSADVDMKEATKKLVLLDENSEVRGELHQIFRVQAGALREARVKKDLIDQPLVYLDEISNKLDELSRDLPGYFSDPSFNRGKFSFQSKKMMKSMKELETILKRSQDGLDDTIS